MLEKKKTYLGRAKPYEALPGMGGGGRESQHLAGEIRNVDHGGWEVQFTHTLTWCTEEDITILPGTTVKSSYSKGELQRKTHKSKN